MDRMRYLREISQGTKVIDSNTYKLNGTEEGRQLIETQELLFAKGGRIWLYFREQVESGDSTTESSNLLLGQYCKT